MEEQRIDEQDRGNDVGKKCSVSLDVSLYESVVVEIGRKNVTGAGSISDCELDRETATQFGSVAQ